MGRKMVSISYTSKLNDVFDRIYVHGVAEVPRAELLLWHDGQQKVTKKLWRKISDAWAERCKDEWEYEDEEIPQLLRAYNGDTRIYYLIWGGEPDADGAIVPWFKPLTEVNEADENDED